MISFDNLILHFEDLFTLSSPSSASSSYKTPQAAHTNCSQCLKSEKYSICIPLSSFVAI